MAGSRPCLAMTAFSFSNMATEPFVSAASSEKRVPICPMRMSSFLIAILSCFLVQRRAQPGHQHHLALHLAPLITGTGRRKEALTFRRRRMSLLTSTPTKQFLQRRHRVPAKLREQPDGGRVVRKAGLLYRRGPWRIRRAGEASQMASGKADAVPPLQPLLAARPSARGTRSHARRLSNLGQRQSV